MKPVLMFRPELGRNPEDISELESAAHAANCRRTGMQHRIRANRRPFHSSSSRPHLLVIFLGFASESGCKIVGTVVGQRFSY